MNANDDDEFFQLLDEVFDLMGKTPAAKIISGSAKALFFKAMTPYTLAEVREALEHHMLNGTYTPIPADIKRYFEGRHAGMWLGANEAWGRISKPMLVGKIMRENDWGAEVALKDYRAAEPAPCIMSQPMMDALALAQPDIDLGRMIDARAIFISAYERLVEFEKDAGRAPKYWVSPGGSYEEQAAVRAEGVRLGLLPAPTTITAPQLPPPSAEGYAKFKQVMSGLQMKSLPPPEAE